MHYIKFLLKTYIYTILYIFLVVSLLESSDCCQNLVKRLQNNVIVSKTLH